MTLGSATANRWPRISTLAADRAALTAIALLAGLVRVLWLNVPARALLDENWYARDGCYYWRASEAACGLANLVAPDRDVGTWLAMYGELTPEHPPLAKWLIGAPMAILDFGPGAWRLSAVAAGILGVIALYLLVRHAFGSSLAASIAALLLAIDYPHFVHSRLAMLEIFLASMTTAALLFCVLDRRQIERRASGLTAHRWWRLAAGVAAGAAAATKLSGLAVVPVVLALTVAWEMQVRRPAGRSRWPSARGVGWMVVLLLAVPALTYLLSYVGRLEGDLLALPWEDGSWLRGWWDRQWYMLDFHAAKPVVAAPTLPLPMLEEAAPYLLERSAGTVMEILLFANPLLWWSGFIAVGVAAIRRAVGLTGSNEGLVLMAFVAFSAGFAALTLSGRTAYLFHAMPIAPLVYLAIGYVVAMAPDIRRWRLLTAAAVLASLLAFAFFLPILTARPLGVDQWRMRACTATVLWPHPSGCALPDT